MSDDAKKSDDGMDELDVQDVLREVSIRTEMSRDLSSAKSVIVLVHDKDRGLDWSAVNLTPSMALYAAHILPQIIKRGLEVNFTFVDDEDSDGEE